MTLKLDDVRAALLRWRSARRRATPSPDDADIRSDTQRQVQVLTRQRSGPARSAREVDDEIARQLAEAECRGDLLGAQGYGQALAGDDGWQQTPDEVRMPFKMLKSAGIVPHEVALMRERVTLRQRVAEARTDEELRAAQHALAQLELTLALRLESLRR